MKDKKIMQQISNLRSWIPAKEVQIHTLKQNIELQTLIMQHVAINIKDGWFIKQKNKGIKEAQTDMERKIAELNLKKTESDVKNGVAGAMEKITLDELKMQLAIEEKGYTALKKQIMILGRNGKLTETIKEPNNEDRTNFDISRKAKLNNKEVTK